MKIGVILRNFDSIAQTLLFVFLFRGRRAFTIRCTALRRKLTVLYCFFYCRNIAAAFTDCLVQSVELLTLQLI